MGRTKWRARKLGQPKTEELRQKLNADRRDKRRELKERKKQEKLTEDRSINDAAQSAEMSAAEKSKINKAQVKGETSKEGAKQGDTEKAKAPSGEKSVTLKGT
ncbi:MAG: hypothetical protein Q9160_001986 [Pyrenula sp. 1 TL-2023]